MNKTKEKIAINVGRSPALIKVVHQVLRDAGFTFSEFWEPTLLKGYSPISNQPATSDIFMVLNHDRNGGNVAWSPRSEWRGNFPSDVPQVNAATEFGRLIELLSKTGRPDSTFMLNDEYQAVVSDTEVVVGCQHFAHETILKLGAQIEENQKPQKPAALGTTLINVGRNPALIKSTLALLDELLGRVTPGQRSRLERGEHEDNALGEDLWLNIGDRDPGIGWGPTRYYRDGYRGAVRLDARTQFGEIIERFGAPAKPAAVKPVRVTVNENYEALVNGKSTRIGEYRIPNERIMEVVKEVKSRKEVK